MSDPGTQTPELKSEPTLFEQTGDLPESTELPREPEENPEEPAPEIKAEPEKPAEPAKPKRTPWYQDRINQLTAQKTQERQAREALEAKLAALAPKAEPAEAQPFKPEQFEQLIDQRAQAIVNARETERRAKGFLEAGNKEFGSDAFQEKCNEVAALGAGDSQAFMALVTDPDVLPEGHKVVAALADNPEEAQRILAMDPLKMASALTRFATTVKPAEKQISNAPAPIKPVGGTAKSSEPSDSESIREWMAKRNAGARTSAGGKPNR